MNRFTPSLSPFRRFAALFFVAALALAPASLLAWPTAIMNLTRPAPGYYRAGGQIEIKVTFNNIVTLVGTPRLVLDLDGGQTAYANFAAFDGGGTITFRYVVQPGQNAAKGPVLHSFDLNGATITGPAGEAADVTLGFELLAPIVDTTAPTVVSIRRHLPAEPNSTSSNFVYRVSFSEPVAPPVAAAFAIGRSGVSGGTIESIRGSDTEWYVAIVGVTAGYGTLRLNLLGNQIADLAGNLVPAFSAGETYGRLAADPVAWGNNSYLQINAAGGAIPTPATTPNGAMGSQTVAFAATGNSHSLVLTREGNLFAWGNNGYGQLGNLSNNSSPTPVATLMTGGLAGQQVAAIAAGAHHNVVLARTGIVFAWGMNDRGQLGRGDFTNVNQPVYIADTGTPMAGKPIVAIAAGAQHTLALSADGRIFAWGDNTYGQLGNNSTDDRANVPVAVDGSGVLAGKHIVAIAAGAYHSLALASDGQLYAWGRNTYGQLSDTTPALSRVPVLVLRGGLGAATVVAIASGYNHNLARTGDGRVFAWGMGSSGQLGISAGAVFRAIVPTAVVTTGALGGRPVVGISAGAAFSSLLTADGTVLTCGSNEYGQLGKGTVDSPPPAASPNNTPAPVSTTDGLAHGAVIGLGSGCASDHTIALAHPRLASYLLNPPATGTYGTGATLVFYLNFYENVTVTGVPVLRLGLADRIAQADYVSGSGSTALVFRFTVQPDDWAPNGLVTIDFDPANGAVDRYGLTVDSALPGTTVVSGIKIDARAPVPAQIVRAQPYAFTDAAAFTNAGALLYRIDFSKPVTGVDPADFTLATTGTATGTIANVLGTGASRYVVVTGVAGAGALRVDLKSSGTGIADTLGNPLAGGLATGPAYVHYATTAPMGWGYNVVGQAGPQNVGGNCFVPTAVPASGALSGKTIAALASGSAFSLALCTDGTLAAWGDNAYGQLGCLASLSESAIPVPVLMNGALYQKTVIAIAAGPTHSLALTSDGLVFAWGRNDSGQLGTNSGDRPQPTAVHTSGELSGKQVVAIATGESHSLALTADGLLIAWGSDSNGRLGNGTTGGSSGTPTPVVMDGALNGHRVVALAAGGSHSLALDESGRVYTWGSNAKGQIGDDNYNDLGAPFALPAFTHPAVAIAAGANHSVVFTVDGGLYAWGANDRYQLGAGSYASVLRIPTAVDMTAFGENTPVALVAGAKHNLARTADGSLFGWGDNLYYQLTGAFGSTVPAPAQLESGALGTADLTGMAAGCGANHTLVLANAAGAPLALIETWRLQYFYTPFNVGSAADDADPDADGRTNFIEYATGTDPINADSGPVAVLAVAGTGASRQLTLTFYRIADPSLTYTVEASTTLAAGSWTTIVPPANPLTGPVTVTDPQFMSSYARRFLRLKIVRAP